MPVTRTTVKYICEVCSCEYNTEKEAVACEMLGKPELVFGASCKWVFTRRNGEQGYLYIDSPFYRRENMSPLGNSFLHRHVLYYWKYTDQNDDGSIWTIERIDEFLAGQHNVIK